MLVSHIVFTVSLMLLLCDVFHVYSVLSSVNIVLLVCLMNILIDYGHVRRGRYIVRSRITHDFLMIPLLSLIISILDVFIVSATSKSLDLYAVYWIYIIALLTGWIHLLMDSLTGRGVYIAGRRFSIAHYNSYDIGLNLIFILVGVILLLISLLVL